MGPALKTLLQASKLGLPRRPSLPGAVASLGCGPCAFLADFIFTSKPVSLGSPDGKHSYAASVVYDAILPGATYLSEDTISTICYVSTPQECCCFEGYLSAFSPPFFLKWTSSKRTLCRMGQRDENAFVHQHVSLGSAKIACWPVQKREHEFEYSYSCLVVG